MLALAFLAMADAGASVESPRVAGNTCGGKPFGYPASTNCCVPGTGKFSDHRTGDWPTGIAYDYTKDRCDPVCGIIDAQTPCTKGNTCGGKEYGVATHTNCCVPLTGGKWAMEQSGGWPNGTAFDYNSLTCDPGCGVLQSSSERCCSGTKINALTHFCCNGQISDWQAHFPCPSAHNDGPTCAIGTASQQTCCSTTVVDIRNCGDYHQCPSCSHKCVCGWLNETSAITAA